MQQKSNNPLAENDFPQEERDRVLQKFQTLSNLYGEQKAEKLLSERETLVLMNTMANEAIKQYDPILVQVAFLKMRKALGGKVPASQEELVRVAGECLNQDEKAALIGHYTQKMRDPKDALGVKEIKKRP